ncbi:cytosine deaminase [Rhizobium sp. SG_E_25_P2]|uniref:cytosine deaminase n=1 Tax=Rhizobium sp. SG_E_25_P2 TaxID=2879942 RepID=UPI0024730FE2|nr:cytosine deaminase [Rhizobium sp. SG_E_25_P2]MDH6265942.1 cytosine deaminase [Rhizobium sp. SG_E_25_P2]
MLTIPTARRYQLRNATIPADLAPGLSAPAVQGLATADLVIADGLVESITPAGADLPLDASVDLRGGMVWPCFTDMHTHLDKGHIWERAPNPDGSFMGALETVRADSASHWSAADVSARMEFSLKTAYAHGTQLIRTHLDSLPPQHRISFGVFEAMREQWQDRIALQAVALFPFDIMTEEADFTDLLTVVQASGGLLGGFPLMNPEIDRQFDRLFRAAAEYGLDIDLHVDETADPSAMTLKAIAEAKLRHNFQGAVTVGHCCSLAQQNEDAAKRVVELVAKADLAVVSLPMCNMYLQDRHAGHTPRWRGVTLVHELRAVGVRVAVASDNTRDPFYAYGDLDPVEVFRESVRILHLDHPLDHAANVITSMPASILGRPELGVIAVGQPADLVLFSARRWSEFLSRPQSDRTVLRKGRPIDRTPPDYRDLDPILGA